MENRLTRRAKAIAEQRGTSVSRLVETFFATLDGGSDAERNVREEREDASGTASLGGSADEHEFSAWACRWRGAFKEPGCSYPDDPEWEKQLLAEEIGEKHA